MVSTFLSIYVPLWKHYRDWLYRIVLCSQILCLQGTYWLEIRPLQFDSLFFITCLHASNASTTWFHPLSVKVCSLFITYKTTKWYFRMWRFWKIVQYATVQCFKSVQLLLYSGKFSEEEIFGNFGKQQWFPKIYFQIFFVLTFKD